MKIKSIAVILSILLGTVSARNGMCTPVGSLNLCSKSESEVNFDVDGLYRIHSKDKNGCSYIRGLVGSFSDKTKAQNRQKELQKSNYKCAIVDQEKETCISSTYVHRYICSPVGTLDLCTTKESEVTFDRDGLYVNCPGKYTLICNPPNQSTSVCFSKDPKWRVYNSDIDGCRYMKGLIGSFSDKTKAQNRKKALEKSNYKCAIVDQEKDTCVSSIKVKDNGGGGEGGGVGGCSDKNNMSLFKTTLTKSQFVTAIKNYGLNIFSNYAEKIYTISVNNGLNPELVVVRAMSEGFSPGGSTNNYWGLHCYNGQNSCASYSSFDAGVKAFIDNIKSNNYKTPADMMKRYAYIGDYWYNPGDWSNSGCPYYPYIKQYLSATRSNQVANACNGGYCSGYEASCLRTTDEDQYAYASFTSQKMINDRNNVFC
ncbi:hypothetical protein PIROE2DRAFT_9992 [Piromyces sp. E2]|nr:hypothetical protein PIROE2DRAFT_9992 [Piromyces sp. E2]|eukprot:OUM63448.1 hypothetical protein PIROE2DRAFT_9992 [Piromyces sp. E2]